VAEVAEVIMGSTRFNFDEADLIRKLEPLRPEQRAAFAAACAQRLRGAYADFCARTGRGDFRALDAILLRLWGDVTSAARMSDGEVADQIEACMALIPQEDDRPWASEQPAAEGAGAALAYALRCRLTGNPQEAAWAARSVYDAVDNFVIANPAIDISAPGAEARVLASPLVQAELARQIRDINELSSRDASISAVRERAMAESAVPSARKGQGGSEKGSEPNS
jgi:uncharacterized protein YjaG (DUF416 family)